MDHDMPPRAGGETPTAPILASRVLATAEKEKRRTMTRRTCRAVRCISVPCREIKHGPLPSAPYDQGLPCVQCVELHKNYMETKGLVIQQEGQTRNR